MPKKPNPQLEHYRTTVAANIAHGDATEHTHRPALKTLIQSLAAGVTATNEPKRIKCGAPDFNITRGSVPLGHIETKDLGTKLDDIERGKGSEGEQFKRYLVGLPNWILTDYLEFRWFVNGERRLTARLAQVDGKGKLKPAPNGDAEVGQLVTAFLQQKTLTITTARELAERLAGITAITRDLIKNTFAMEPKKGWLHRWHEAFGQVLLPDLTHEQFADIFAQTIAYGLFAARIHTPSEKDFSREMAAFKLPKTNPFLRKLFAEVAGVDMPETIGWAVEDTVQLLKHVDVSRVVKDFGKGVAAHDPVVHFYETFLAAYNPRLREIRGVYYTPEPVVSYIVRSIDKLLRTRFSRAKGLADEHTLILDPAVGTATFLYFVVAQIHNKFTGQKGAWDGYVAKHLLNRVFGFELLVAPYAVAHLKLGMELEQTGYTFKSDQRLGIFLTNTLEAATKKSEQLFAQWVSDEANAAASIKRERPILVVLGNPPYSGHSANRSKDEKGKLTFIGSLIEDYKRVDGAPLKEKNPKWLHDDYVKFIRFAEWRIRLTGEGIVGYITNSSYLDNPTFRGMRQHLMSSFDDIYVLNLHGSVKKAETPPDGGPDENVFDIQQGVALLFAVRNASNATAAGRVHHADLWGSRATKYEYLLKMDQSQTEWTTLTPDSPFYLFVPQDTTLRAEYAQAIKITDAMPVNVLGFQTHRDHFAIAFDEDTLIERMTTFRSKTLSDDAAREKFELQDNRDWQMSHARERLRKDNNWHGAITRCLYRPFDIRYCYFSEIAIDYPRRELIRHVLGKNNLCLLLSRQLAAPGWRHSLITRLVPESCVVSAKTKEQNYAFPLYLHPNEMTEHQTGNLLDDEKPNFSTEFLELLANRLGDGSTPPGELPHGISPEDVMAYAYAVFSSPSYRTRYAPFLQGDFPRLPVTSDSALFKKLVAKGQELISIHLLEHSSLSEFVTEFPEPGSGVVEKIRYDVAKQRVWINDDQYFGGVTAAAWEAEIGSYQPSEKWLRERTGRVLTYDDIQHYQKVVAAIARYEVVRLDLDQIIAKHGGWPLPGSFEEDDRES